MVNIKLYDPSIALLGIYASDMKIYVHKETWRHTKGTSAKREKQIECWNFF